MNIDSSTIGLYVHTISKKEISGYSKVDIESWIKDSQSNLKPVYSYQNNTIDEEYISNSKPIIERQMVKAVIRLKKVIESYF